MNGRDQYFFELPIYLEPEDTYYERLNQQSEKWAYEAWRWVDDPQKDLDWYRHQRERSRHTDVRSYGGSWAYSQIFGFLGIYPLGSQLRGATWYTEKKLARRNISKKDIIFFGKAFELTVQPSQDSHEIFAMLMETIQHLRRERPYRRRYLETRPLELAVPFLDWRRLMDISTSCGLHGVRIENLPDLLLGRFDRLGAKVTE